jgi:hypothetical protein
MTAPAKMCRRSYLCDNIQMIESTNSFNGQIKIEKNAPSKRVVKIVDNAVKIETVTDKIRNKATGFWRKRESSSMIGIGLSAAAFGICLLGVAGGAAAIGGGIPGLAIAGVAILATAVAAGVIALVALGITIALKHQAKKHLKAWQDPAEEVARHRQAAQKKGYPYLNGKNDLRRQSFAPGERHTLALRTMDNYLEKYRKVQMHSSSQQVQFVEKFFNENPLARKNRLDAFGIDPNMAHNLLTASNIYQTIENSYENVVNTARYNRKEIAENKEAALRQLARQKMVMQVSLKAYRARAMRRLGVPLAHRADVGMNHWQRARFNAINTTFGVLSRQVEYHFAGLRGDVLKRAERAVGEVNLWENARKQKFIVPIGRILEAFVNGRNLNSKECQVEEKGFEPEVKFIFPSFDLKDLCDYDSEGLFGLDAEINEAELADYAKNF